MVSVEHGAAHLSEKTGTENLHVASYDHKFYTMSL